MGTTNNLWAASVLLGVLAYSCGGGQNGEPEPLPLDERLAPGQIRAGVIRAESELLQGPEAHGWIGDFKLYNDRVAFIVQNIESPRGWGPYGGSLLDADRIREEGAPGCDLFQEMFPILDLLTMQPVSADLLSDGADGQAAVLRLRGEQRGIPIVDAALGGALEPKDLEIIQDYILEPDADFLRIRTELRARSASGISVSGGDLILDGDQTTGFVTGSGPCREPPAGEHDYIAGISPRLCYLYNNPSGSKG